MAPAIEVIIEQNERSLHACETMLASLAMVDTLERENTRLKESFVKAMSKAQNNITEKKEPIALNAIIQNYSEAFEGKLAAKKLTVESIQFLGEINREAMVVADKKARQIGNAGAWGIVFMAIAIFLLGMLFQRNLKKNLVRPLEEIHSVLTAFKNGDKMRRCTGFNLPKDIKTLFNELNDFLDKTV